MDDKLTNAAAHVGYELHSLVALLPHLARFNHEGPAILKNAVLEALLVHARTLIEFVAGRPTPPSGRKRRWSERDIRPELFGLTWEPLDTEKFDRWLDLIDKHLSHLSLERTTPAP